ncbi:PASTA domain-containing protein [Amycolatopsis minnesotensis]|uniref:PASTA domain-containing protein n=1 Tax=Amycolatopsis minnesotensis TaxID=337894 RepID=UPI0031E069CB
MPAGRAKSVIVPDVVGLPVTVARQVAAEAGVALAQPDPDGPPLGALTWPGVWVIDEQAPAPGARVRRWDSVVVRFHEEGGGSAGVREPRRPLPEPRAASAAKDPEDD